WKEAARVLKAQGIFRFQVDGRRLVRTAPSNTWEGVTFGAREVKHDLTREGFEVLDVTGEQTQYMWVTARLNSPGESGSGVASISAIRSAWIENELRSLIGRL